VFTMPTVSLTSSPSAAPLKPSKRWGGTAGPAACDTRTPTTISKSNGRRTEIQTSGKPVQPETTDKTGTLMNFANGRNFGEQLRLIAFAWKSGLT
jgi:hypothetical protein